MTKTSGYFRLDLSEQTVCKTHFKRCPLLSGASVASVVLSSTVLCLLGLDFLYVQSYNVQCY